MIVLQILVLVAALVILVVVRRQQVTPGSVACRTILHLKSGRRSYSTGHTDVMGSGTQITANSMVLSMEEEMGYDRCSRNDPSMAGARNFYWEEFMSSHAFRYLCIVYDLASGRTMLDTARACGIPYHDIRELRDCLVEDLEGLTGPSAIADAARIPQWRSNLMHDHEKWRASGQAQGLMDRWGFPAKESSVMSSFLARNPIHFHVVMFK